jgi:acyl-CoA dehydrogenase family protein 9
LPKNTAQIEASARYIVIKRRSAMSDSEVSFMHALCMGQILEGLIHPFPKLSEDERETLSFVLSSVDDLLTPHAADFREWDAAGELPADFIEELRQFGVFGLVIPEEHGGMGFGATAYSRTLQQVARHDASVAVTIGAHSSIGMRGLLLFGTEEQKARYLPRLATGEQIAAFCLTEPGAGSDAASIRTTAVRDGDDWVLNGSKLWITNGGIADFFTVFAKTGGAEERRRMSAFIVTRDMAGVSTGPHEDKMGLRASSTTMVHLDNVRVPADHLLGEENHGFKVAMKILNSGRTGLGGGSVGAMKRLIELSTVQAKGREQFGRPIAEYGLIKKKIGQMVVDCYAAESVVNVVNGLIDGGHEEYAVEAAISKIFATEALWRTADEALQISGGNGFMREYPYERFVRDSRINRIFDDPIKGFGVLSDYTRHRARLATGIGASTFTGLAAEVAEEAAAFEDAARKLGGAVDRILRKHGKNIIGKQFASERLADIMIDLFVLASVLSRVSTAVRDSGVEAAQQELTILRVFSGRAIKRVETNLARIDDNDDEPIKELAAAALAAERFSWDNV